METKPRYISDVIGESYRGWKNEFIILDSGTCSGKTFFVLNTLMQYAKLNKKSILYLCNRAKLRRDIQEKTKCIPECPIDVMSYQSLQKKINKKSYLRHYDYVVADEVHYLTSDSFNQYTDLTFDFIMKQRDNITIFMSATAQSFFNMLKSKNKVKENRCYRIEKDYSYVGHVFFYNAKALPDIIDGILTQKPNEKIIVFCNSEKRMSEMHEIYKDKANYYCAEKSTSPKLREICDSNCIMHHSDDYITFPQPILFTTKVLDNGIDLKDTAIKHIFTEIFDLDSMVQSLGRKRALSASDTCDFYIKNYTKQGVLCFANQIENQIAPIRHLKSNEAEFNKVYGNDRKLLKNNKILYMSFGLKGSANNKARTNGVVRINRMMYTKYALDSAEVKKMLDFGYATIACSWLGADLSAKVEMLDIVPQFRDLFLEYIDSIAGKKLFKEEQADLKAEFIKIGLRDRTLGIHTLNGKLKDMEYPYKIVSKRDRTRVTNGMRNPNRDTFYWLLSKAP